MDPATHEQPKPSRLDPVDVARIVNARGVAAARLAEYRASETSRRREVDDDLARDIEQLVATLYDLAERLHSVELLADYAAERAELADGG
jgi:alkylation response protein AidB-like acyl-CoA dehydrogenase